MQVILLKGINGFGNAGDAVDVKPGFARNYLIPKKIALRATKHNMQIVEEKRSLIEEENLKHINKAQEISSQLSSAQITLRRKASEDGKLYGSVTAKDIVNQIDLEHKLKINTSCISIEEKIRTIGDHYIVLSLHKDVSLNFLIRVISEK